MAQSIFNFIPRLEPLVTFTAQYSCGVGILFLVVSPIKPAFSFLGFNSMCLIPALMAAIDGARMIPGESLSTTFANYLFVHDAIFLNRSGCFKRLACISSQ